ncbi:AGAP002881-PB [Anopheles gambiae str. PEST]|uniref:AGAP002881-PB n=1 Tax=Anopheles gambiae TaxID=7165 RepID=F5HKI3_ANOGA|nr:AGAP002881-PB [Anopheles gambiae str. PEST]
MDRKRSPQRSRQSVTTASSSQPARPASRGGQGVGDPHHHHHHVLSLVDGHGWAVGGSQDHRQRHSTVAGQLSAVVRQAHCCVRQNAAPSLGGDSECVQFGAGERRSKTTPRERRSGTAGRRSAVSTVVWIVLSQLIHVGSVAASQALDADPGNSNASNAGNAYGNRFGRLLLNGTRSVGGAGPSLLGASTTVLTTEPAPFDGGVAFAAAAAADGTASAGFNDSSEMPQIPEYIRATSMVFCIIIMCLGVIGNVMVPIVILKTKDMRNSTNIFLTNLSIADLLVLLVCTPTVLVEVNSPPEVWVLGEEMCNRAVPFVELTVAHASVLTILAISFERYYAICEPLKAGYVCTKTRALLICLAAWTVAAILTSFWPASFFVGSIVLFFIVPLLILVVLYSVIAKNLMENPTIIMSSASSGNRGNVYKYRKQVIFMLGAVVVSFFVCLLPFRALTLWIIIVPSEAIVSIGIERFYILLYFCRIMLYMNSAINPILYNLMSSKFRNGFLQLLGCGKIVRSDSISSGGTRKGGGTFHTGSTNLSSSHGTSQRKGGQREESSSSTSSSSLRRPTVQFQHPPVSDEWHPGQGVLRRHSSIISIRGATVPAVAGNGKSHDSAAQPPLSVRANGNKIVEEEEVAGDGCLQQALAAVEPPTPPPPPPPLPNSNGFHRFKDRVRIAGSRQSYRARLDFHHYRTGGYVGHGQLTATTTTTTTKNTATTEEEESTDVAARPDDEPPRRSNDNNRFSLLHAATAALATATTAATATAVMVIVAASGSVDLVDESTDRERPGERFQSVDPTDWTGREAERNNGKESPALAASCIAPSPCAVGSMECDI